MSTHPVHKRNRPIVPRMRHRHLEVATQQMQRNTLFYLVAHCSILKAQFVASMLRVCYVYCHSFSQRLSDVDGGRVPPLKAKPY